MRKKIVDLKNKTKAKLIVKEYPTASAHVATLDMSYKNPNIKKDFQPDIIFVDYQTFVHHKELDQYFRANSYTLVKSIAEELSSLCSRI